MLTLYIPMKAMWFEAAISGDVGAIESMLEEIKNGICGINVCESFGDRAGSTALHHAAKKGHTAVVKILLDNQASVDLQDKDFKTALHYAVEYGYVDITKMLFAAGASVYITDNMGSSALDYAIRSVDISGEIEDTEIVNILAFTPGAEVDTALPLAAKIGYTAVVRRLLDNKADVNFWARKRKTALHYAAENGRVNITKMLLAAGADVDMPDTYGRTALIYAIIYGHTTIVKILLDAGADVTICDKYHFTAFDYAKNTSYPNLLSRAPARAYPNAIGQVRFYNGPKLKTE